MKIVKRSLALLATLILLAGTAAMAEEQPPAATVVSVAGAVTVGAAEAGPWLPVTAGMNLAESQILRTGPQSQATVKFTQGQIVAAVGENTTIGIQDLLLKASLEKMRDKIAPPTGGTQTKMSVTPLTGVRATDQAEDKAEEPNRQHYWQENAPAK
jgi:hypothetical protein